VTEVRGAAIVLGAGAGRRIGADEPKAFLSIGGRTILSVAVAAAAASPAVAEIVVTCPEGFEERARSILAGLEVPVRVIEGGVTRQASVHRAMDLVPGEVEAVAVHDAARPFAPPDLFTSTLEAALLTPGVDGAIPVLPIADTVKRVVDGIVVGTEPREDLWLAQTPQAFRAARLRAAHRAAAEAGLDLTDDAAVVEWAGGTVSVIPGDPSNTKITTLLDLARAEERMGGAGG
jgi:2-C-methyl-D-erythritol 4-phosphate cytidylyltransferase/2-C-methyl-D-erythritol 2,4-cyclodiphosphate synthase